MYGEITTRSPHSESEEMEGMNSVLAGAMLSLLSRDQKKSQNQFRVIYKELISDSSDRTVLIPETSICDMEVIYIYVTISGARLSTIEVLFPPSDYGSAHAHAVFSDR